LALRSVQVMLTVIPEKLSKCLCAAFFDLHYYYACKSSFRQTNANVWIDRL
jgi:hypothetical protein